MSVNYKDYYEILGVSRSATEKEIKSAFRKLARQYHPDVDPNNEDKFKEINEAYEVLGDPQKRKRYDSLGSSYRHGGGFEPPPGFDGFGGFGGGNTYSTNINIDDILGGLGGQGGFRNSHHSGFSDFFDLLFGQMGGQAGPQMGSHPGYHQYAGSRGAGQQQAYQSNAQSQPPPGQIEQTVVLHLSEVATGVDKKITLNHSGKNINVTIPKGVKAGSKIRLAGEGMLTPRGKGDALLIVQYQPHPHFTVDGNTLTHEAQVPVPVLVLGGEITVPTLKGDVTLTIPRGTQPGRLMRLKRQGLPGKDETGDLMVRLKAHIPEHLSADEESHYQALKELGS